MFRQALVERLLFEKGLPMTEASCIYKMNSKVKAVVETPIGRTAAFKLTEIVR